MKNKIRTSIMNSIGTKEKLITNHLDDIQKIITISIAALKKGGKLIFCGNGGSAADSQHIGRLQQTQRGPRAGPPRAAWPQGGHRGPGSTGTPPRGRLRAWL